MQLIPAAEIDPNVDNPFDPYEYAAAGGHLLGMLTYVPGPDWEQCEILTLHAAEQWHGAGTAMVRVSAPPRPVGLKRG